MRLATSRCALTLAVIGFMSSPAWAEQGHPKGMGMPGHHYDTSAEVTLKGTVTEVKAMECDTCGAAMGSHLVLKTEAESVEVMLGPAAFLEKQDFAVSKGDEIEVTGAKVKMGGNDVVLAREVKKGDKTVTLRDKTGRPMWAGKGGRHR